MSGPSTGRTVAYDIDGVRPGTHLAIPSPTVTLIVDLGAGLDLTGPGLSERTTFRCCISGMHPTPYLVHHDGVQRGVQVALAPSLVRALTGAPASAFADQAHELGHLFPALAAELTERTAAARASQRSAVAATVLERFARDRHEVQPDAAATWSHLARSGGRARVGELVERSGWSARYLTTKFTAEFGMSIKHAARLMRFDVARGDLITGTPAATVAANRGYSDQAHLSREFGDFLGMSPSAYLAARRNEFVAL